MDDSGLEPIAIVGIGCRFPGDAVDSESLWSMLAEGRNAWSDVPQTRFNWGSFFHPSPEKQACMNHRGGHFIRQDVAAFDTEMFGISPLEAKAMDPQQRLLLEITYEAVENAGITMDQFKGSDAAVYAAMFSNDYERLLSKDMSQITRYHLVGSGNATFANRISHAYDLHGPSMTLDTGCSGSLVAIHQACRALQDGEAQTALAGGAVLMLSPDQMIAMSQQHILNVEGRSFSFDTRGSGYGRGEGAAMILLKRLRDAERDCDPIRAVIRGSAVNQDGRTNGLTSPSQAAQILLAQTAFRGLDFSFGDIQYVEAHGTGTTAGDGAELGAIHTVYCEDRSSDQKLLVGSVKQNIGHLEPASGVAGLIKTVLSMEKKSIPPNILFQNPKPGMFIDNCKLQIPTALQPWPSSDSPLRAVVNNFGYGGTNALVILEARAAMLNHKDCSDGDIPDKKREDEDQISTWHLITMSAHTSTSLAAFLGKLQEWLQAEESRNLCDIAYTLSRRTQHSWRKAVITNSVSDLCEKLGQIGKYNSSLSSRCVFVFTGQGAQWPGMGFDLMRYRCFSESILRSRDILSQLGASWSLVEELFLDARVSRINESTISQPLTTALQIAMVDLLRSWNIFPEVVIGHSSGEIAAAYAANIISHRNALAVAHYRGHASHKAKLMLNDPGGMLAVGLGEQDTSELITKLGLSRLISVACHNSPVSTTVSGDLKALIRLQQELETDDTFARLLKVDTPYHSPYMQAVAEEYMAQLATIAFQNSAPTAEMYSSVDIGKKLHHIGANYWTKNLLAPVNFTDAISKIYEDLGSNGHLHFLELGPHSALKGPIRETINSVANQHALAWSYSSCLVRKRDGVQTILGVAARLFECGTNIKISSTFDRQRFMSDLPPYQWDHSKTFWHESRLSQDYRYRKHPPHNLLGLRNLTSPDEEPSWRVLLGQNDNPWLADHMIDGISVFPATAYLAIVAEAARQCYSGEPEHFTEMRTRRVCFKRTLEVPLQPAKIEMRLSFRRNATSWVDFRIFSNSDNQWNKHCEGQVHFPSKGSPLVQTHRQPSSRIINRVGKLYDGMLDSNSSKYVDSKTFYETLTSVGNEYGSSFALVKYSLISSSYKHARATISLSPIDLSTFDGQGPTLHPILCDAALQVAVFLFANAASVKSILPVFFQDFQASLRTWSATSEDIVVCCELQSTTQRSTSFHAIVYDTDRTGVQRIVMNCEGELHATGNDNITPSNDIQSTVYQIEWNVDPSSITSDDLESINRENMLDVESQESKLGRLLNAANYYVVAALKEMKGSLNFSPTPHHSSVFRLLNQGVQPLSSLEGTYDAQEICDLSDLGVEGELITQIGRSLRNILCGQTDALTVLLKNQLLYRVYQDDCTRRCNEYLSRYIQHVVFKNPAMRILEIGAGTGGSTIPLFHTVSPDYKSFAKSFDFTDISPGFFGQASGALDLWKDFVTMKVLDIEKDPLTQGYDEHDYDLILASNVLHATRNIQETLAHVYKLLKPGGILAFIELVHSNQIWEMSFGLLPGWWTSTEDERCNGPLLSVSQWNQQLKRASFTTLEIVAYDFPGKARRSAFMVSRSKPLSEPNGYHVYRANVINTLDISHPGHSVSETLCAQLAENGYQTTFLDFNDKLETDEHPFVIIDCHDKPFLANCTSREFDSLLNLVGAASRIVWITVPGHFPQTEGVGGGLTTGFSRTARSENDSLCFVTIDVQDPIQSHKASTCTLIAGIIASPTNEGSKFDQHEFEYRITNGKIYIPRIKKPVGLATTAARDSTCGAHSTVVPFHSPDRLLQLRIQTPGLLNTLHFQDMEPFDVLNPEEIEIEVQACGINFKDLWTSLGKMTPSDNFVGECSGTITKIGTDFTSTFQVGDRVCALTATPYCNNARVKGDCIFKIPDSLSFCHAASIPVAFSTAFYSLVEIAHLEHGQSVLIHAGSGALGQAAIQISKYLGATIYTTISSDAKRQLLVEEYGIPDDHILSSRSTSFKAEVLRHTNGQGVDVVLNSLSGELLHASWECIAEMGTFVEVGKMDIRRNGQLDMENFEKNVTFSSVDMILLAKRRSRTVQRILKTIFGMFENGILRPVTPVSPMPITDAEQAFRLMQSRKHTGKIVLETPTSTLVKAKPPPLRLRADAAYIVVGGLGKLGTEICSHLGKLGATIIILLTRKQLDLNERLELERNLSNESAKVRIVCCDVSNRPDVQRFSTELISSDLPIGGIIHGPMVLRDKNLQEMTIDDFQAAINPKYHGSRNLVEAFQAVELDFFILLSSLSGIVGLPGQANYAAGNAYQDALVQGTHPYPWKNFVSLDITVLADTHMLPQDQQTRLGRRAMSSISNEAFFPYLDHAMSSNGTPESTRKLSTHPTRASLAQNYSTASRQLLIGLDLQSASEENKVFYSRNAMFSHTFARTNEKVARVELSLKRNPTQQIKALATHELHENEDLVAMGLREKIASLVAVKSEDIRINIPIADFGLDSLVAIELKNWIRKIMGAPIQTSDILDAPSLPALVKLIIKRVTLTGSELNETQPLGRDRTADPNMKILTVAHGTQELRLSRLPLPSLEDSLYSFWHGIEPFGTVEERKKTQKAIEDFHRPGGIGHLLHSRLKDIEQDDSEPSWLSEVYNQTMWLQRRTPLRPTVNFFSSHVPNGQTCQADKAAILSLAAYEFKKRLDRGEVEQDFFNDEPQCMESLKWIFNCSRRPCLSRDETLRFPNNDYIIAMRHGYVFQISLVVEGSTISRTRLAAIFKEIVQKTAADICWASVLTVDERDSWARTRQLAIDESPKNKEYFDTIENSLFVVCLDDGNPSNSEERIHSFLLDGNENRWNDKTLSFIVCENGASAFWCEHSMIDGSSLDQLGSTIDKAIADDGIIPTQHDITVTEGVDYIPHAFQSSTIIDAHIERIRHRYSEDIRNAGLAVVELPFGERYLRQHTLPPKGVIQAIISLAVRQQLGHSPASYETVSLRSFKSGRVDIHQVHTLEMEAFVSRAISISPINNDTLRLKELLQHAVHAHASGIAHTSRGRGWDRHIRALRYVLQDGEEEPSLFKDPLFLKTRPGKVFVSFSNRGMPEWGNISPNEDAIWIAAEIGENT
ncbi:polyketide synthase [Dendryphion nanum]|uniref:Polyketide synthase n=1 Tax=Dendryphion nanum TaxID=256645 RepID=A0A9P9ITV0_9PLEO|nr:polyketide synthase [Dendryphion nanum]